MLQKRDCDGSPLGKDLTVCPLYKAQVTLLPFSAGKSGESVNTISAYSAITLLRVIFLCLMTPMFILQLYRCGLRLEEISDQIGYAVSSNNVPHQDSRRNIYTELLNR